MPDNEEKKVEPVESAADNTAKSKDSSGGNSNNGERQERQDRRGGGRERGGRDSRDSRGPRRGGRKDRDRKRDSREEEFKETLIDIYRCSATVKGGRRLSFGALVTVGDGKGRVGIGYGKAKEVPGAIQKAIKKGRKEMYKFPSCGDGTIPHQVKGRFGASEVLLIPARPGTGVIAGAAVKAILEAGGLKNVLTKSYGSNNTRNLVKATMVALRELRSKELVQNLRGVEL